MYIPIKEACSGKFVGEKVSVRGWIYRKRVVGGKAFIVLRDSTGIIQCVAERDYLGEPKWAILERAGRESSMTIHGVLRREPRAPTGFEIYIEDFNVIGFSENFPIRGGEGIDYLLDYRHLWLRSRKLTAIMKIKHTVMKALREYYNNNGWWEVTPPILTASAVEGGATLFPVDFFGRRIYLSQSAQLYLEVLIYSLEKVWSLTPSFRAERSRTRRHLYEYWHFEAEAAWMDYRDMMRNIEDALAYTLRKVLEENLEELELLKRNTEILDNAIGGSYPKITYDEAIDILRRKGVDIKWGDDLGADEEAVLTQEFDRPFFITHFPKQLKSFYMKTAEDNPDVVLGFDLLAPEGYGEIIGGSQREDNYDKLLERIREQGLNPDDYQWYLDLRRYGSIPHSGYGLGIERFVMWIAGLDHIRDAIPFPRFRDRIYP